MKVKCSMRVCDGGKVYDDMAGDVFILTYGEVGEYMAWRVHNFESDGRAMWREVYINSDKGESKECMVREVRV